MNKFFVFLVGLSLSLLSIGAEAQNRKIDSLENLLKNAPNDSLRICYRLTLAYAYNNISTDKAIELENQSLQEAKALGIRELIRRCYSNMGISFSLKGNHDSAIFLYKEAIKYADSDRSLSITYQNLGVTYSYQSRFGEALGAYFKGLELAEKIDDDKFYIYGSIANAYNSLKNFRSAAQYDSLALVDAKQRHAPEDKISLLEGNYANSLIGINKFSEARKLLLKVVAYSKKNGDKLFLSNYYESLGLLEQRVKNYSAAFVYYQKSLQLNKEVGSDAEAGQSYYFLAELEFLQNKPEHSKQLAGQGMKIADSLKLSTLKKDITLLLSRNALIKQDFDTYLHYDSISKVLLDSINMQEQARAMSEIKTWYETEKKERENTLLKEKELRQSLGLKNQQYAIIIITGSLIAVVVFLAIVYRNSKITRRINLELVLKNKAIEDQQERILVQSKEIETKNSELHLRIEEIQRIQEQLIQSEKMASLGQVTAGMAHEINNPLNFISGGVEGLTYSYSEIMQLLRNPKEINKEKVELVENDTRDLFKALNNGVERVAKIINSLRYFSSPQDAEHFDTQVNDVIEMTITLLSHKIKEINIHVDRSYQAEICPVLANSTQLSQVFLNIMDNSIQAMETVSSPRTLKIETKQINGFVEIIIADNGVGIAESDQLHVMEPFFTTKPVGKGTGLGLSISYGIVEKHKGEILFSSEVGKGTSFLIKLPCSNSN